MAYPPPNTPPPDTNTLGIRFSTREFGGDTNLSSNPPVKPLTDRTTLGNLFYLSEPRVPNFIWLR